MTADPTRATTSEDNLGVTRIFHININCRNLEVSLSFYQRLGFKVLKGPDHIGGRAGDSVQTGLGFPERTHGRGALLRVGEDVDATLVDLIEWTEPATHGDACDDSRHVGVPRIALLTADLHAAVRELKGSGVEFLSDPVETKVLGAGERWVCFKDPDGLSSVVAGNRTKSMGMCVLWQQLAKTRQRAGPSAPRSTAAGFRSLK